MPAVTVLMVSAHELTKTRLCQARDCEHDAEPLSMLCNRCDKRWRAGHQLHMNEIVQPRAPDPALELHCTGCKGWKPDAAFALNSEKHLRRGRRSECRECCNLRRNAYRLSLDPIKRAQQKERDAKRKRAARERDAARRARLGWPPS